jgi:transcriptional regulator of aromatic amino acid metabolism
MNETTMLLDPTAELTPEMRERIKRPADLKATTIGLLNISKPRGEVFLDELEKLLSSLGLKIRRYQKPTFTRVAPLELKQEIRSQCQVVIEALAD